MRENSYETTLDAGNERSGQFFLRTHVQFDDIQRLVDQEKELLVPENVDEAFTGQLEVEFGIQVDSLRLVEEVLAEDVQQLPFLEHNIPRVELEDLEHAGLELVDDLVEVHVLPEDQVPVAVPCDDVQLSRRPHI